MHDVAPERRNLSNRIDDIEVLRAIAVLMTMIGHFQELLFWGPPYLVQLWGGVDLFFCISGFVIARSLIIEAPSSGGARNFLLFAIPFWIKRVFRIWPAAFTWLACQTASKTDPGSASNFDPLRVTLGGQRLPGRSWSGLRSPGERGSRLAA
jgi:peptidoglycan/LPS O-acetylase OafA/YrhL